MRTENLACMSCGEPVSLRGETVHCHPCGFSTSFSAACVSIAFLVAQQGGTLKGGSIKADPRGVLIFGYEPEGAVVPLGRPVVRAERGMTV